MKKQIITSSLLLLSTFIGVMPAAAESRDIQAEHTTRDSIVVSVDVTWGSLNYTHSSGNAKTWNPLTHQFTTTPGQTSWQGEEPGVSDTIKVTNHSNTLIQTNFALALNDDFTNCSYTVERLAHNAGQEDFIFPSQEGGNGESSSYQLSLSGSIDKEVENAKLGTLQVTISSGFVVTEDGKERFDLSGVQGDKLLLGELGTMFMGKAPDAQDPILIEEKREIEAKGARLPKASEAESAINMFKQVAPEYYAQIMACKGFVVEDGIYYNSTGTMEVYPCIEIYEQTLN